MNNTTTETTTTGPSESHVREEVKALVVAAQNGRAAAEVADKILSSVSPAFTDELETKVFEALGAASTCWESLEGTGVFDSDRAKDLGDELVAWIRTQARLSQTEPLLGLARTRHLINELSARCDLAVMDGQEWPSYRPAGDPR